MDKPNVLRQPINIPLKVSAVREAIPIGGRGGATIDAYTKAEVDDLLTNKVDKENGKSLSTNDFTTAEKAKLTGIESGATANIPASTAPAMDGEASAGSAAAYARADHRHPTDNTRAAASDVTAISDGLASISTRVETAETDVGSLDVRVKALEDGGGGGGTVDAYTKAQTDTLLAAKVDKETGKGLSTNDYTTSEKDKLSGIADGATANTAATVSDPPRMDGTASVGTSASYARADHVHPSDETRATVDVVSALAGRVESAEGNIGVLDKRIEDLDVPVKVSDLENDAGYQTAEDVNNAIDDKLEGVNLFAATFEDLPPTGDVKNRYFVSHGGLSPNIYDEYVWAVNTKTGVTGYEKIGPRDIDTTNFVESTRTVNGKALSSDITLTGSDIAVSAANSDKVDVALGKKADKVTNAVAGHLASIDAFGDLADSGKAVTDIASPSSVAPLMDGTAAVGTSEAYARADHVHPTDTLLLDGLTDLSDSVDRRFVDVIEAETSDVTALDTRVTALENGGSGGGGGSSNLAFFYLRGTAGQSDYASNGYALLWIPIPFEEGMTFEQFVNSKYNGITPSDGNESYRTLFYIDESTGKVRSHHFYGMGAGGGYELMRCAANGTGGLDLTIITKDDKMVPYEVLLARDPSW